MAVKKFSTPGVYRQEIDLSESVAPAGTSTGAIVLRSIKGPINRPVLVSSEKELYDIFGKPVFTSGSSITDSALTNFKAGIPNNGYGTYAAIEFLKESNALYVSRAIDTTDKYSSVSFSASYTTSGSNGTSAVGVACVPYELGVQFDKPDFISTLETAGALTGYNLTISSLFPGDEGNNIAVSVENYHDDCDWVYKYDGFPISGSVSAGSQTIAKKVVRIDVFVKDASTTWNAIKYDVGTKMGNSAVSASYQSLRDCLSPVETFYVTMVAQKDANGFNLFAPDVINGNSSYIYVKPRSAATDFNPVAVGTIQTSASLVALGGGVVNELATGLGYNDSQALINAWNVFATREFLPNLNLLLNCDWDTSIKQKVASIAATRMDCLAFGQSGKISDSTTTAIMLQEQYGYVNPSYMALYAGYDKIYDANNDKYFYIPKAVFAPAICARTDRNSNTWDAPAGQTRGIIPSIGQKFLFTQAQIGQLYDKNINTSTTQPGVGTYMLGQKTAQLKNTYLSRINVRRDLLYIENSIEPLLNTFLFELNDDRTRQRVTSNVDTFLSDVQASGGLVAKEVVCDDSNNTADVINNNQLICDIYVQPPTVIEFIQFRTVITKQGATITRI